MSLRGCGLGDKSYPDRYRVVCDVNGKQYAGMFIISDNRMYNLTKQYCIDSEINNKYTCSGIRQVSEVNTIYCRNNYVFNRI